MAICTLLLRILCIAKQGQTLQAVLQIIKIVIIHSVLRRARVAREPSIEIIREYFLRKSNKTYLHTRSRISARL